LSIGPVDSREPRDRRCIAVDKAKLRVKKSYVYVWSAVDVDSKELLALEASYGRSCLNALSFLKKALRMCTDKPLVLVDKGPLRGLGWSIGMRGSA
jgi:putative transposase